jgi:biopolymer transport protein ExbD
LIGKRELREHESVKWVDGPKLKETLEDLAKYRRPREEVSILIDPIPSTPWTEVIRLMDSLKAMGFERMEFAAPFKVGDPPKK